MSPRFYVGQVVKLVKPNNVVAEDGRLHVGDILVVRRIYVRRMLGDTCMKQYSLQAVDDTSIEFEVGEFFMRNNTLCLGLGAQVSKLWRAIHRKAKSNGKDNES